MENRQDRSYLGFVYKKVGRERSVHIRVRSFSSAAQAVRRPKGRPAEGHLSRRHRLPGGAQRACPLAGGQAGLPSAGSSRGALPAVAPQRGAPKLACLRQADGRHGRACRGSFPSHISFVSCTPTPSPRESEQTFIYYFPISKSLRIGTAIQHPRSVNTMPQLQSRSDGFL